MINLHRCASKQTMLYNNTYRIEYLFYSDIDKASFRFDYVTGEAVTPIRFQYADVDSPRAAYKVASAFLRGWTKQHLESGWTGLVDLPAPNKLPRQR